MTPRVMILGCGPAGLFAAHAAQLLGCELAIVSKKRKSEMYGAQYLHWPIPELVGGEGTLIQYRIDGTPEQYRQKVYGDRFKGPVSPETLDRDHLGWDIRQAYDAAWLKFGRIVQDFRVDQATDVSEAIKELEPDLVISSIPAPMLCFNQEEHLFKSEQVWAIGDAPERGVFCPVSVPPQSVICNGLESPGWYRASNVFGYCTAEWAGEKAPPLSNIAAVTKPLRTTCDCLPEVVRVGRYGTWTKGVLSHEAFTKTMAAVVEKTAE